MQKAGSIGHEILTSHFSEKKVQFLEKYLVQLFGVKWVERSDFEHVVSVNKIIKARTKINSTTEFYISLNGSHTIYIHIINCIFSTFILGMKIINEETVKLGD